MSKENIAIIGAGGFGNEVYHIIDKNKYKPIGFIDIKSPAKDLPLEIIGSDGNIKNLKQDYDFDTIFLAIGDINKRAEIAKSVERFSLNYPEIIHTSVIYNPDKIGKGSIIYPGTIIMNNCRIGEFSLLNSGVTIGHDVNVGNFCNINSGVNLAGRITIGDGSFLGIGATVRENIRIGKNSIVGAGSVVVSDVPDNSLVYGVPAKQQ